MKTLSDKYKLIQEGKYNKRDFLREAKRTHPKLISNTTNYRNAVKILKKSMKQLKNKTDKKNKKK